LGRKERKGITGVAGTGGVLDNYGAGKKGFLRRLEKEGLGRGEGLARRGKIGKGLRKPLVFNLKKDKWRNPFCKRREGKLNTRTM